MSLTLKLTSLFIRTAAKPIANVIKGQARQHERFRKIAVAFAQQLHRIDMRLRLGLLQDPAAIERQIAREAAEADKKRLKAQNRDSAVPTAKTKEQATEDEKALAKEKKDAERKVKEDQDKAQKRMIRPLSEAKAIDSGANFISEAFLFMVAGGLIVFETLRSRRKENTRKEDVQERLVALEEEMHQNRNEENAEIEALRAEIERLRAENQTTAGTNQPVKAVQEKSDAIGEAEQSIDPTSKASFKERETREKLDGS